MLTDTHPEAEAVWIDLWRRATPARRLRLAMRATHAVIRRSRRAVENANPTLSPWGCILLWVRSHYGDALADELVHRVEQGAPMSEILHEAFDAVQPVVEVLSDLDVPFYIGGSLASSMLGVARSTLDADLVAALRAEHLQPFCDRLRGAYYLSEDAVHDAVTTSTSCNLIHLETMYKIDVFVPKADPFDIQCMTRRKTIEVDQAAEWPFCSAEDIVLHKLKWYRAGGDVSERQWLDVVSVIRVQAGRLDTEYLRHWAAELGVDDLLARALAATEA